MDLRYGARVDGPCLLGVHHLVSSHMLSFRQRYAAPVSLVLVSSPPAEAPSDEPFTVVFQHDEAPMRVRSQDPGAHFRSKAMYSKVPSESDAVLRFRRGCRRTLFENPPPCAAFIDLFWAKRRLIFQPLREGTAMLRLAYTIKTSSKDRKECLNDACFWPLECIQSIPWLLCFSS